jgi:hypothetical protein
MEDREKLEGKWKRKKLAFILLSFLCLFWLGMMFFITSINVRLELNDHLLFGNLIASQILKERVFAPAEQVSHIEFFKGKPEAIGKKKIYRPTPGLSLEVMGKTTEIVQTYPEVVEIYYFSPENQCLPIFTRAPSAKIHEGILKNASKAKESLFLYHASWDTSKIWLQGQEFIDIEGNKYIFIYTKKEAEFRLTITDPEKLKPILSDIFKQGLKREPILSETYFRPHSRNAIQVNLYDEYGKNFFTLNKPQGNVVAWKKVLDHKLDYFPWRMTTKLFNSKYGLNYLVSVSFLIKSIIAFAVMIFCILWLAYIAPKR